MIKTWQQRCEEHPDHQQGIVTQQMIQDRMQEEIDELRQALAQPGKHLKFEGAIHVVCQCDKCKAQPEQEPVVGMFEEKLPDQNPPPWVRDYKPKREWVGVTYDEVYEFVCITDSYIDFAKAIEAKLKEKNT